MIDPNSIEQLKLRIDIADIIGHYIPLKRVGHNCTCLCPFHDDKNPSMSISSDKGLFHCFSCGAGGDAIKFVMDYEKLSYPEAVEKIASISNFTLNYIKNENEIKKPDKKILDIVNAYYRSLIFQNKFALNYLYDRGLNDAMIEKFEVGFAPDSSSTIRLLQNEEIDQNDALDVGIIKQNQNGLYASFISRVTFPIRNHAGNLVGFGGRTLAKDNPAKYVNSPQSKIFDKSTLLYGYDKAKTSIYEKKQMIIVEGYMDVIMLHKAGFTNSVAVLGTALTQKHIPLIKRGDIKVILSFDGDNAGINAAIKSSALLVQNGIEGSVVIIENGEDPADMVKERKIDRLKELFDNGMELGQFYIKMISKKYDITSPIQKQKAYDEISEFLRSLPKVMAMSYEGVVSEVLNLDNFRLNYRYAKKESKPEIKFKNKDYLELSILKSAMSFSNLKRILVELCEKSYFRVHKKEYGAVVYGAKNEEDEGVLRELDFDESVEIYKNEDTFLQAIKMLKIKYYEGMLEAIKNANIENKLQKIEKINSKIMKLKGLK
ncbi:DNA primase [Campylobacter sputorum]|uniref:DNA primase n=1 Tax=Campylobacter sputorum TaxID=206 RepID=UPI00053BFB4D|nr:DNA primase [Campylobacter sputorum]